MSLPETNTAGQALGSLDPKLRQRLGLVGLFQRHVAARMVAALCFSCPDAPDLLRGLGREDWRRMLDAAASRGLLEPTTEGNYTIAPALAPVWQGELQAAFPGQGEKLERAFCAVYARAANQFSQIARANPTFGHALLSTEEANLKQALALARQYQDQPSFKEILDGLKNLLLAQGRETEWRLLAEAVPAPPI